MKKKTKKKKTEKQTTASHYIPIFLAAAILVIGAAAFILEPAFLGFFDVKAQSFEEAVQIIKQIDLKHNISFSDYEKGLEYIYHNPREDPLNAKDIDLVLREYSKITGNEQVKLFADFRINLLEAEKYYKLSQRTYKADIHSYGLKCKNEPHIFESVENQNISLQKIKNATTSLLTLKGEYPDDFKVLNISDEWIELYLEIPEDFQAEMTYKINLFNKFCTEE